MLQEYFMDLYLLAELKTIALKITTVDMLKPPADFRYNVFDLFLNFLKFVVNSVLDPDPNSIRIRLTRRS
jgi:hypothetical protein